MVRELRARDNATCRPVWCVRPKRLAAYTRQMDVVARLRTVPEHTDLLAVEYKWARTLTRTRKTWCACELISDQAVCTDGRASDGGEGVWLGVTLAGV
jgi:hypothetical protein